MYPACRTVVRWAQRGAFQILRAFGPRALPGRIVTWQNPVDSDIWQELVAHWVKDTGEFDSYAVFQRSQAGRRGFSLLLHRGNEPVSFVKLRQERSDDLEREARVLELISESRPKSFHVPRVLRLGRCNGWSFLSMAPLEPLIHPIPRRPPLSEIIGEIQHALMKLPRPPDAPSNWRPMHGDLTPWNLRRIPDGEDYILIDWEYAKWGPPLADEVLFRAITCALMGHEMNQERYPRETIAFWLEDIPKRPGFNSGRDAALLHAMLDVLNRMEPY